MGAEQKADVGERAVPSGEGKSGRVTPRARREGLIVEELTEETLVYDLETHRVHCLNRTASLVWRMCDGRATVDELARSVRVELGVADAGPLVWLALHRLGRKGLLEEPMEPPEGGSRLSRRELARRVGLAGAALALPVVSSIVAPTAAQAATGCLSLGDPCDPASCGSPCSPTCDGSILLCRNMGGPSGHQCVNPASGGTCP